MMAKKWALFLVVCVCVLLRWISINRDLLQSSSDHLSNPTNEKEILFFFRVPKTGSEMTVLLLQWLQGVNNFRHVRLQNTVSHRLTTLEQVI